MTRQDIYVGGNRYRYDFRLCRYSDGWLQIDSYQDASYYGHWLHLSQRIFIGFAEGDEYVITFDSVDEMCTYVRDWIEYERDLGYIAWIDEYHQMEELKAIGLDDLTALRRSAYS